MRVIKAGAMPISIFLSVPLLGLPIMLAICVEFLCTGLTRSNSPVSDILTLLGFLAAYFVALALLFLSFSAENCLLWCFASWPMNYVFCQLALRPME
ncbi:hypothetical protein ACI48D_21360 [Massilia sp. LXY-6]|uniref:hypothetical protein n=1 Tax=Massilia sp. LXY-6 TaxID=3379823 RepID=UPI003EE21884